MILKVRNLDGKILIIKNFASKIMNFQHLASKILNVRIYRQDLEFTKSCRQGFQLSSLAGHE